MGRSRRKGGVAAHTIKAAQRLASAARSLEGSWGSNGPADDIARAVYGVAATWPEGGRPIQMAPAAVTASWMAQAACDVSGIPATQENLSDVTSMILDGMLRVSADLSEDTLADHRAAASPL